MRGTFIQYRLFQSELSESADLMTGDRVYKLNNHIAKKHGEI